MVMRGGCVIDPQKDICSCDCHKPGRKAMHVIACCSGPCVFCRLPIKSGAMERHLENCGPKCGPDIKNAIDKYLKHP